MPQTLTIRRPDDFHCHVRQGDMMRQVLPFSTDIFGRVLLMPNTDPAILTGAAAKRYLKEAYDIIGDLLVPSRAVLIPTIKITPRTTPATIRAAKSAGVSHAKLYPDGVTTNSEYGVTDMRSLADVYATMQEVEMALLLHGEMPGVFVLDRESLFLGEVLWLSDSFTELRITLEHITTLEAVDVVNQLPDNVGATITVHHLMLTLDDVIGDKLMPHHFCKPVAKTEDDRQALIAAATSGPSKFFLGTDSAPHDAATKECSAGAAGIFSAPNAMPLLAQLFEEEDSLDQLQDFASENGAHFYGLPLNDDTITLVRETEEQVTRWRGIEVFTGTRPMTWRHQTLEEERANV